MRPLTEDQTIHERDAALVGHEFNAAQADDGANEGAAPHSRARRIVSSLRRAYSEMNAANMAVDRMNRPWVYQGRDVHRPRTSARRASH